MLKKDIIFFIFQFFLLSIFFLNIGIESFSFSIPIIIEYILYFIILIGAIIILFGVFGLSEPSSSFPSNKSNNREAMFAIGIYKYIRNPIYTGILTVFFASSLVMGSGINIIITILLGLSFYLKSRIEEERLVKEYSNYKEYKKQVGRFLPKLKK